MIPGEIITKAGDIVLNEGRETVTLDVANTGDRPIQAGSHYHFFETNGALDFPRDQARGMRLDIPAGTTVRFEPGETKTLTYRELHRDMCRFANVLKKLGVKKGDRVAVMMANRVEFVVVVVMTPGGVTPMIRIGWLFSRIVSPTTPGSKIVADSGAPAQPMDGVVPAGHAVPGGEAMDLPQASWCMSMTT